MNDLGGFQPLRTMDEQSNSLGKRQSNVKGVALMEYWFSIGYG